MIEFIYYSIFMLFKKLQIFEITKIFHFCFLKLNLKGLILLSKSTKTANFSVGIFRVKQTITINVTECTTKAHKKQTCVVISE